MGKIIKGIICLILLACIAGIVYAYINVEDVIEYRDGKTRNSNIVIEDIKVIQKDDANDIVVENKIENNNLNIVSQVNNNNKDNVIENIVDNKVENNIDNKVENNVDKEIKNVLIKNKRVIN